MPESSVLVRLSEITKCFSAVEGTAPIHVLNGVSLDIRRGETMAITGPSGSGKSTLLNIIGTLEKPTSGRISLESQDLTQLDDEQLARVRNEQIGLIFQSHHLLPQCTVLENVLVPTLALKDRSLRGGAPERAKRLLDRVGLGSRLAHRPGQLSGGERQRVAVVRALINNPKLILADEPTGALDRGTAQQLAQLLGELNREEAITLVVVTHALDLARRMQRVMELTDGKIKAAESRSGIPAANG